MSAHTGDHPKWSAKEFQCFLMILASEADLEFSAAEKKYILDQIDSDCFRKVKEEYDQMTDFQHSEVIKVYKPLYYPTPEARNTILEKVRAVLNADGHYDILERNIYRMLKKLM